MKYEEFCNTVIASLNNQRFEENENCGYLCLDNISIRMTSEIPDDIEKRTKIWEHFNQDYPDFSKHIYISGFNHRDVTINVVKLLYNNTVIFKQEFISITCGGGNYILLPSKLEMDNAFTNAICTYLSSPFADQKLNIHDTLNALLSN